METSGKKQKNRYDHSAYLKCLPHEKNMKNSPERALRYYDHQPNGGSDDAPVED
ncbi:hypothetical protein ATPR_0088 [Acetobacter tropicalis NBRC 101654]|uniref:Uncharacterized protein n=1 Tax=Acetobacter tropicalis NBRC 101654 TaxID=749388 RepID=F7V9N9_9PROT|nr:hypothetical protein ATPR_0088 [Acetobacter tropicalis NBRC 101654]